VERRAPDTEVWEIAMSCFVIAEIGSNHCNDASLLCELIETAYLAGCDAVKLQSFKVDRLWTTQEAADARRKYEPKVEILKLASDRCEQRGIEFMCSPFDVESVEFLRPLVRYWKVASAHIGDRELADAICQDNKNVFVSTGAIRPERLRDHLAFWKLHGKDVRTVTPLHCVARYPAKPMEYGLQAFLARSGARTFGDGWGLSDHTIGIGTAIAAVSLGACVVEKHIALADQPPSPDDGPHALRPDGLRALMAGIRQAEAAILGHVASAKFPPGRRVWR
jgi:sialic acid synthase SpsE